MTQPLKLLTRHRQPREKLSNVGKANLTDTELLSLILGSGTKQFSVTKVAQLLLQQQSLTTLPHTTLAELTKIQGIGSTQASRLLACIELGKRMYTIPTAPLILSSEQVLHQVSSIRNHQREHLVALYLNARQELVQKETITIGGLNYTNVNPRDVFALAVTLPAAYVVLVHNHPSGNAQPSQADLEVTERLVAAGQLLGIMVIDHLIVTTQTYYSFKEGGLL
jgi:DNA repair protein RadC